MQYIEAPNYAEIEHLISLFLAGGITDCPDWQSWFVDKLAKEQGVQDITVLNPRRAAFDIHDQSATTVQIAWEFQYLRTALYVLFWFPKETMAPITLYKLGGAMERYMLGVVHQDVFVGTHPSYCRIRDVQEQTKLSEYSRKIEMSLEDLYASVVEELRRDV